MANATIYEIPKATLADIPRVLRQVADDIEAGDFGAPVAAAIVLEADNGEIRTFGAGAADYYRALALFSLGAAHLAAQRADAFV